MTRLIISAFIAVVTMVAAPLSWAAPIGVFGTGQNNLGSFTGTLDYTPTNSTTGVLDVTLTNTSASGFLTAIALNDPDSLTGISLVVPPTPTTFNVLGPSTNGVNASPLGNFDFGAAIGNSWTGSGTGGGAPSNGLADGATATFRFNLTGSSLDVLTTNSFVNELSITGPNDTPTDNFMAVRFRGLDAEPGSDKASASVVPLPAAVWLFGAGVIGLAGLARRHTV